MLLRIENWELVKSQNLGLGPRKYIIASTDTRLRAKGRYGDMITWYLKSQNCLIFSQIWEKFSHFLLKMRKFQLFLTGSSWLWKCIMAFTWHWLEISLGLNQLFPGFDSCGTVVQQVYYGIVNIRNTVWYLIESKKNI